MWEFINNILNGIKDGKGKKIFTVIIIICILILVLYPYIDANFSYFNRVEKRISILEKVTNLDTNKINDNQELKKEYESIIKEINKQNENSISNVIKKEENANLFWNKFIAGGFLWWILGLCVLLAKNKDNTLTKGKKLFNRIGGMILCLIIGGFAGAISGFIPTIITPWINYIGFPILIIILMVLILYKKN